VIPRRRGFTLIEMLCVMVLLAVVAGIMALLLRETLEVERTQAEGYDKILHDHALADQFRADVAQAEDAPATWQAYTADAATLILQMKNKGHVVYTWEEDALTRRAFEGENILERALPVHGNVELEFVRTGTGAKVVRMRLIALLAGNHLPGQTFEIVAGLGGDWR
jgi:prepilin-type N-terminal cleavage/methylation domain-containing protein